MFNDNTYKTQTERIYKVPLCIQDTIPIYRISQGAFLNWRKRKEYKIDIIKMQDELKKLEQYVNEFAGFLEL
jgi:hypothetical protein